MEKVSVSSVLRPKESNIFNQSPVHQLKNPTEEPRLDSDGESDQVSRKDKANQGQTQTGLVQTWRKGIVTMARRNARERNRVRQVNQGFLTLCHHIPEPYRMKKMSKVDTLRSAVDYIRNLERFLQSPEVEPLDGPAAAALFLQQNETTSESTKEN